MGVKEVMSKKRLGSYFVIIFIIVSFPVSAFIPTFAESLCFHSVYGYVYINDVLAEDETEVKLTFIDNPDELIDLTDSSGYYQIDFKGHNCEEGFFSVKFEGEWLIPFDNSSVEIVSEEIYYEIDLHILTLGSPPDKPVDPEPANNSENVPLNPSLNVHVNDSDNDSMNVSFYNAEDNSLIGIDRSVPSGGTASVVWGDLAINTVYFWYTIANDSVYETRSEVWNFKTIENQPPNKPENPFPENGAEDVDINLDLSVDVCDPDGDPMDVTFHNASDNSIIGTDFGVPAGTNASVKWESLSYNKTYSWYAIADDSLDETKSDTWSFTTETFDDIPPEVSIVKPQKGLYIFGIKILPRFIRPALIIGKITIESNATDDNSGIERVVFYINGKEIGNATAPPYTCVWKKARIRLLHIFIIKVVAIDYKGNEASDKMIVRKFL